MLTRKTFTDDELRAAHVKTSELLAQAKALINQAGEIALAHQMELYFQLPGAGRNYFSPGINDADEPDHDEWGNPRQGWWSPSRDC